ncbi:MAG: hypothetical protein ITD42_03455 [Nitrosospira sp.]|nr:hypothetical protein [Nitrosospira sp.]MDW7643149.1 hypothetical protein [Nitrosomonadaceae bacterium]MBI0414607.1 hypothetical protein [Nitrosospira sp.]MBI0415397.1 hypothetical protein [Nitrosospira sp.]MBI0417644.1 hypothetical protein [Nitrosospira sp.]
MPKFILNIKLLNLQLIWSTLTYILILLLGLSATPIKAECVGCICPGNPCGLCALPPMKEETVSITHESNTCSRVRSIVAPTLAIPGTNEHFASMDKSIIECVKNGGDIIKNSRRSREFPSKHYCKPSVILLKSK